MAFRTTAYTSAYRPMVDERLEQTDDLFRDPGNDWQCVAIVREVDRKACPARQCVSRRRSGTRKGEPRQMCCVGHRALESQARRWASHEDSRD